MHKILLNLPMIDDANQIQRLLQGIQNWKNRVPRRFNPHHQILNQWGIIKWRKRHQNESGFIFFPQRWAQYARIHRRAQKECQSKCTSANEYFRQTEQAERTWRRNELVEQMASDNVCCRLMHFHILPECTLVPWGAPWFTISKLYGTNPWATAFRTDGVHHAILFSTDLRLFPSSSVYCSTCNREKLYILTIGVKKYCCLKTVNGQKTA